MSDKDREAFKREFSRLEGNSRRAKLGTDGRYTTFYAERCWAYYQAALAQRDAQQDKAAVDVYELVMHYNWKSPQQQSLGLFASYEDAKTEALKAAFEKVQGHKFTPPKDAVTWTDDGLKFINDDVSYHYLITKREVKAPTELQEAQDER